MANRINGTVVRIHDRGFAFVKTEQGEVFVHARVAKDLWQQCEIGAAVDLEYEVVYNSSATSDRDRYRKTATKVYSIVAPEPAEELTLLTLVDWYDDGKGYGFIHCGGLSKPKAFLSADICRQANIKPGAGMPVRAIVTEGPKGPFVKSFEWGPAVEKEYAQAYAQSTAQPEPVASPEPAETTVEADPGKTGKKKPKKKRKSHDQPPAPAPAPAGGIDLSKTDTVGPPQ